jgi:WD40 repeat protein
MANTNEQSGVANDVATSRPRRRWRFYQFSLRTFLLAVALIAIVIATQYRRTKITTGDLDRLELVAEVTREAFEIVWSPDRTRVAVHGWERPVEILDAQSLETVDTFGEGKKIVHFAFGPNEDLVAYCENNKTAKIVNRLTDREIALATGNDQPSLVFSPDGKYLSTGGYGTEVSLWNTKTGELVRAFDTGEVEGGLTPRFSPDGAMLAVGNRNSTARVFDVTTGNLLSALAKASSQELAFSPRGDKLVVTYVDASFRVFSTRDWSVLAEQRTGAEELYSVDWSPDGSMLVTAGLKGSVTVWDAGGLSVLRELPAPEWVVEVRFSPDGMNLLYAGGGPTIGSKRTLQVWGIEGPLYTWLHRPRE